MPSTLVTGASGFAGTALCRRLIENGHQVIAFVRATSKVDRLQAIGVDCKVVDITNKDHVLRSFDGVTRVFHLAAAYRTELPDRNDFHRVNVTATRNLLDAASEANVKRFIHCSTVGVHGEITRPPADETYRVKPGDHYQGTKLLGELLARERFAAGLPGVVVRPAALYGPGDTRFLKLFRLIQSGRFVMIGNGRSLYHMTYIDDFIDGMMLVAESGEAVGDIFTIAGQDYTTIRGLAETVAEVLGKPPPSLRLPFYPVYLASVVCDAVFRAAGKSPPLYPRRVEFFHRDRAFSIEKARRRLGYSPKVSLFDGVARTARWYMSQGLLATSRVAEKTAVDDRIKIQVS